MSITTLENKFLSIEVNSAGAELYKIFNKSNNSDYLWDGNKEFWGRRSPILFPFVGKTKNMTYTYNGKEYPMTQHGFARDKEFSLLSASENKLVYSLKYDAETEKIYPFKFELVVAYELEEKNIKVSWIVKNLDSNVMYFSIGAHPAFLCAKNSQSKEDCYLKFGNDLNNNFNNIKFKLLDNGLVVDKEYTLNLSNNSYKITKDLFDNDALIFENSNISYVSLLDSNKNEYVKVSFKSPLFGLWSPKREAPFVCIEPWYGRCDSATFNGLLEEREFSNKLDAHEEFNSCYSIEII